MPSTQRTDDDQDFADRTIVWFEKLFPVGAIVSAIFAGFILIMPGSRFYTQSKFSAVGSLLLVINVLLCGAFGLTTAFSKPQLKAALRAGGMRKVFVSGMSLVVQILFLTGMIFFFLVMDMVELAQGIIGIVFMSLAIVAAIYVWVVQLINADKGVRLPEQE